MKLLFCPSCHDVHGLVMQEWRKCLCGQSGGQYNKDGMTATVGGSARVFGVGNPFFEYLYPFLKEEGKRQMWKKFYGHEMGDCWWGEYEGDVQILRIESPDGPRLDIRVVPLTQSGTDRIPKESGMNLITVTDKRKYMFCGNWKEHSIAFQVPANANVKLTRWSKNATIRGDKGDTSGQVQERKETSEVLRNKGKQLRSSKRRNKARNVIHGRKPLPRAQDIQEERS